MSSTSRAARAALTVSGAAVVVAGSVLATAAPASANTPVGWEETDAMSVLDAMLLFVGGPLVISVVLALLVMAPSAIRGGGQQAGLSRWSEPQWFGGGDQAAVGRSGGDHAALEAPAPAEAEQGGGAGARW